MRKKWIKLFPLLIGAVIAYCLLWYVIPQNKGGEVAAILVAAYLLFFLFYWDSLSERIKKCNWKLAFIGWLIGYYVVYDFFNQPIVLYDK